MDKFMKKAICLLVLAASMLASGCTSETSYGSCVGIGDDKNPALVYKLNVVNAVVGLVFVELIVPPVIVLADETYCPVGKK